MLEIKNEILDTINKITEHLEFLGYKIEQDEENKNGRIGKHDNKYNLLIYDLSAEHKYNVSQIFFQCSARIANTRITLVKLKAINLLNEYAGISSIYLEETEEDVTIIWKAVYLGLYKKDVFSHFLERFTKDQELTKIPEINASLLSKDVPLLTHIKSVFKS